MRARSLKPSLFKNEELADLGPYAMILFEGLWCMADRSGRLEDRPRRIKAEIMPYWDVDVDSTLQALAEHGFITRYAHSENYYIEVTNFTKHQHPHIREAESTIPAPDQHSASTVQAPEEHASSPSDSLNRTPELTSELETSPDPPRRQMKYEQRHEDIARELAEHIIENNPREKVPNEKQIEDWANTARLMEQRDKREMSEMFQVLRWSQRDTFWRKNIKSMGKFRDQYARLWEQMHEKFDGARASTQPTPLRPKSYDNDLSKRRAQWS